MALSTPSVRSGSLHYYLGDEACSLPVGKAAWFTWLESATLFSFAGAPGTFTARKEPSRKQREGWYWRAYSKRGGKLYRVYLGKGQELTQERLTRAAALLAERSSHQAAVQATPRPPQAESSPTSSRPEPASAEEFVSTKLGLPPANKNLVDRQRLLQHLEAAHKVKLTLISASPGSGKTTLAAEWLRQCHLPVAWLALDASDNDPARFWTYVSHALDNLRQEPGQTAPRSFSLLQPPAVEQMVAGIINQVNLLNQAVFLAFDDWHVIESSIIHVGLSYLLEHLPSQLHVLITSRIDPALPLARMRVRGELLEVRAAELRFNDQEAADFLNQVMSLNLNAGQVSELETRTEGWIAGLQLAAISMQGLKDTEAFIQAFKGNHRFMLDYLTEEVLSRQPEDVRNFLLQTSILKRMTAELVEELTGCRDGQAMLEHLASANLFVVELDQERGWYRYHNLFGEYLQKCLQHEQPEHVALLHRWAADWYAEKAMPLEATEHALAAHEFETAARLIEQVTPDLMLRGEVTTLLEWLKMIPAAYLDQHPVLNLCYAWGLVINQQINEAQEQLDRISAEVKSQPEFLAEVTTLEAVIAAKLGNTAYSVELCHRALAIMSPQKPFLRLITLMLLANGYGYSEWGPGHLSEAINYLEEAINLSSAINQPFAMLTAMHLLAFAQRNSGQLRRAYQTSQRLLQLSQEIYSPQRLPLQLIAVYLVLSDAEQQWNKLDEALKLMEMGRIECEKHNFYEYEFIFCAFLAHLRYYTGDITGADQVLERMTLLEKLFPYTSPIKSTALAYRTLTWLEQGRLEDAVKWMQSRQFNLQFALGEEQETAYLAMINVLIAQGREPEAVTELEYLLGKTIKTGLIHVTIEALLQLALLRQKLGDQAAALAELSRALEMAQAENFIHSFARHGAPMAALLEIKLKQPVKGVKVARNYLLELHKACLFVPDKKLAAALLPTRLISNPTTPPHPAPLLEPLSGRELDVLRLSAQGLTGLDIARELVLSLSTVNWHLKNIYGKLDVHNRTQALTRARELKLL